MLDGNSRGNMALEQVVPAPKQAMLFAAQSLRMMRVQRESDS